MLNLALLATLVLEGPSGWWWAGPAVAGPIAGAILAPVFLAVIAFEIAALLVVEGRSLPPRLRGLVAAQIGLVALTPTLYAPGGTSTAVAVLGSALVVAMFVLSFQFLYRNKQVARPTLTMLVGWPLAALVSGLGWFLWAFEGSTLVLAASVVVQLGFAMQVTLGRPGADAGERVPWLLRPFAIFEFLLFAFLSLFFLGALLDLRVAGPSFLEYIPFAPYSGSAGQVLGIAVYNGLWFGAAILASAWFLLLLGFTMGPLVALKIRETHERPQRIRLGLTIAAFGLVALYVPSLFSSTPLLSSSWLETVPLAGWGFGLRAGGPFESGIFAAVVLMYVFVGVLSVMFGRKAICSVMCGAALLYQGTAVSEMRGFNQTSRVGRYFLGSKLSTAYVVFSGVALVSLFAVSILALLHWVPAAELPNGASDTAALPLPIMLYFGGIWFVMFVSTPFIGTYNCATTGFCHWGALTIPFARVGFFRLKVRDKAVCQRCTTFDCAKACEVGLVDMPLYLRRDGEYRSTKCIGLGDCVGACPYGNLYHQDIRHWIRKWVVPGAPRPNGVPGGGTPLPMVRASPPAPSSAARRPSAEARGDPTSG